MKVYKVRQNVKSFHLTTEQPSDNIMSLRERVLQKHEIADNTVHLLQRHLLRLKCILRDLQELYNLMVIDTDYMHQVISDLKDQTTQYQLYQQELQKKQTTKTTEGLDEVDATKATDFIDSSDDDEDIS